MRSRFRAPGTVLPSLVLILSSAACAASPRADSAAEGFNPSTRVRIAQGLWEINGKPIHAGSQAEGLLLNVRMVNSTFEDRNPETCPKGFDPQKNTQAFVDRIPEYVSQGVRAFTLCLQGGDPGYEGAINSAYEADGSLRAGYLERVARVIEACDRAGAVVILGCLYQRQDQILEDAAAVEKAVENTARWLRKQGYTNVLLEIANEHAHDGFDHAIIKDPLGVRKLIRAAREACPGLLVSASGMGGGRVAHAITVESDFVLLHFNAVPIGKILARVASADKVSKAIVCNEDPRTGKEGASALETTVNAFCSWGFAHIEQNQHHPFKFEGVADDPIVYAKFKELSTP